MYMSKVRCLGTFNLKKLKFLLIYIQLNESRFSNLLSKNGTLLMATTDKEALKQ